MKRLFAAIKISPDENFINIINDFRKNLNYEKIKWVEAENIHLTLKFFGETNENLIDNISDALKNSCTNNNKFSFTIKDTGIFGSSYKPRVIWFGIDNKKPIINLYDSINRNLKICSGFDFKQTRENFVPHLSIGRIKSLDDKKRFQKIIDKHSKDFIQKICVDKFYLFESILRREGPVYKVINEFELNNKRLQ